jgi:hypothetical protein
VKRAVLAIVMVACSSTNDVVVDAGGDASTDASTAVSDV